VRTKLQGRKARLITEITRTALKKEKNKAMLVGYSGQITLRREQGSVQTCYKVATTKQTGSQSNEFTCNNRGTTGNSSLC
jgi:hypothetical protein